MTRAFAFHYFRLPRYRWALMLLRMWQLGADTVYTPIPWHIHEAVENKFDFRGIINPRGDLVGFIDLCAAMQLNVILDLTPGPTSGASLLHHGVPLWLLHKSPEIRAKDKDGRILPICTVEHPTYVTHATRWFDQVSQTLSNQQHPEGPISGVRVAFGFPTNNYPDYNDHIAKVRWPIWLRKRYAEGSLAAINAAYQPATPYSHISQISLTEKLSSEIYTQDRRDFYLELGQRRQSTYQALLQDQGWSVIKMAETPPHGFQVPSDAQAVGSSFQWSIDAPLRVDGSPTGLFWALKDQALTALEARQIDEGTQLISATGLAIGQPPSSEIYHRLLINGNLLTPDSTLVPTPIDRAGETDFYIAVASSETPLTGYLGDYLYGLLVGKIQILKQVAQMVQRLATALEPTRPISSPTSSASAFMEAQSSLTEANLALQKAAMSIGTLEDVFTVALNKPETPSETAFLLPLDGSKFSDLRQVCLQAVERLTTAIPDDLTPSLSLAQYQRIHQTLTETSCEVSHMLEDQLVSLREKTIDEPMTPAVKMLHNHLAMSLHLLAPLTPLLMTATQQP